MTRMILTGLGGIVIVEIYAAVMQRQFQHTDNQVGKGFAILGIYLFAVTYCRQRPSWKILRDQSTDSLAYCRWHAWQHGLGLRLYVCIVHGVVVRRS
jgi:hypothetical protein